MEADFLREYSIDLPKEIDALTYRKFTVMLNGLSADSRWQQSFQDDRNKPRVVSGQAAEDYIRNLKGGN
ncbi:MAG: Gp15 family bacteriophage protein [Thermoleophilia bacterium]